MFPGDRPTAGGARLEPRTRFRRGGEGCARGKLIFGAGAGLLTYIIRVFGGYPDGVAFAILLMNLGAPLIDLLCQPPIFGMKDKS